MEWILRVSDKMIKENSDNNYHNNNNNNNNNKKKKKKKNRKNRKINSKIKITPQGMSNIKKIMEKYTLEYNRKYATEKS